MDQAHPLPCPMVVRSLDLEKDPFGPKRPDEEALGPDMPYLSAIGALIYLKGTKDLGLFYTNRPGENMVGYADAGYLSDPHQARSQTGYVFTHSGAAICWRSTKQTLVATSSNHAEIIAMYEASRELVWLRSMTGHVLKESGLSVGQEKEEPMIIYEDNAALN
ncbi:secreted RxLR effector protein 161-like [Brassica napus]|uniref:secreted RxLR effector protein 161-like n=1 Tax=Brassica napus TaxID=3708 RepID=UPI0020785A35|nr:secreted RxLR effector protein 161-like [Brassica napus]